MSYSLTTSIDSSLPSIDQPIPELSQEEHTTTHVRTSHRRRQSIAFVAGSTIQPLMRTPPGSVLKSKSDTFERFEEESEKEKKDHCWNEITNAPQQTLAHPSHHTTTTPSSSLRTPLAPRFVQSTTPVAGLSSALKQARARLSISPKQQHPQTHDAMFDKENSTPSTLNTSQQHVLLSGSKLTKTTANTNMSSEFLSPLRFQAREKTLTSTATKITTIASTTPPLATATTSAAGVSKKRQSLGFQISASPLAVSLANPTEISSAAPVPLQWSTPVRNSTVPLAAGRKSLTSAAPAPTSADPRVESVKERVATVLKMKRKLIMSTPIVTPRPSGAPSLPLTELSFDSTSMLPSFASFGDSTLTPYSAATEQTLAAELELGTPSTSAAWMKCMLETPEPSVVESVTSDESHLIEDADMVSIFAAAASSIATSSNTAPSSPSAPTPQQQQLQQQDVEMSDASLTMETVMEEEVYGQMDEIMPSLINDSSLTAPGTPTSTTSNAASTSSLTASPVTLLKFDRAMFSRELIANMTTPAPANRASMMMMTKKEEEPIVEEATAMNYDKDLIASITSPIRAASASVSSSPSVLSVSAPVVGVSKIVTLEEKLAAVNSKRSLWRRMAGVAGIVAMVAAASTAVYVNQVSKGATSFASEIAPIQLHPQPVMLPIEAMTEAPVTKVIDNIIMQTPTVVVEESFQAIGPMELIESASDQQSVAESLLDDIDPIEMISEDITVAPDLESATLAIIELSESDLIEEEVFHMVEQVSSEREIEFVTDNEPQLAEEVASNIQTIEPVNEIDTKKTAFEEEAKIVNVQEQESIAKVEPIVQIDEVPSTVESSLASAEITAPIDEVVVESATVSEPPSLSGDDSLSSTEPIITSWTWSPSEVQVDEDLFALPFTRPTEPSLKIVIHPAIENVQQFTNHLKENVKSQTPTPIRVIESTHTSREEVARHQIVNEEAVKKFIVEPTTETVAPSTMVVEEVDPVVEPTVTIEPVMQQSIEVVESVAVEEAPAVSESSIETIEVEPSSLSTAESEPISTLPAASSSSTVWSWSTGWLLTGLATLCLIGAWLQSLESALLGTSLDSESHASEHEPSRRSRRTRDAASDEDTPSSSSPFSFEDGSSQSSSGSLIDATPMLTSSRPSLSPIRPVRKIHFTPSSPASSDRLSSLSSPSSTTTTPPPFANMASRLDRTEPAFQAVASVLAQGAVKLARHVPANPSIGTPALRMKPRTNASVGDRLHVDVPMMIPPRVAALSPAAAPSSSPLPSVAEASISTARTRTSTRRMTQAAPAATIEIPTPVAQMYQTRRSTRLSRRA